MSSAAQFDETSASYLSTGTEGGGALKQLAAERLAAHRSRRAVVEGREAQARREQAAAQAAVRVQARRDAARSEVRPDASRVRDAVAARYQQSLSYREFLAAEAQRAMEQAQAEAEIAARKAKAVAEAQRQLLEEIAQWNEPSEKPASVFDDDFFSEPLVLEVVEPRAPREAERQVPQQTAVARARSRAREVSYEPLTPAQLHVRLPEEIDLGSARSSSRSSSRNSMNSMGASFYAPAKMVHAAPGEMAELDDEIEFRLAPEFGEILLETQPIQANIIEFPRQLVASRKARPRLAEGPLREDGTPEPQLRIFEVEAEQISAAPEMVATAEAPEWQGLLLGAGAAARHDIGMSRQLETQLQLDHQFYAAPLQRRMLAAAVDALCIGAGFAAFAAAAVKLDGDTLQSLPLTRMGTVVAATLVTFLVLYKLLFFTLNDATPGMRAARIAFCTFGEDSPSRKALRRRLWSTALAASPLCLGLLWTALDGDRLGWHDRMSRMYPRTY